VEVGLVGVKGGAVGQRPYNEHHQQDAGDDQQQEERRRRADGGVRRLTVGPPPRRSRLAPGRRAARRRRSVAVVPPVGRRSLPAPRVRRGQVGVGDVEFEVCGTVVVVVERGCGVVVQRTRVVLDELGLRPVRCSQTHHIVIIIICIINIISNDQ